MDVSAKVNKCSRYNKSRYHFHSKQIWKW